MHNTRANSVGWLPELTRLIGQSGCRNALRYSAASVSHYDRLARDLASRFADDELARAGFLHGLTALEGRQFASTANDQQALDIVAEWERLRAIDPRACTQPQHVRTTYLSDVRDPRSLVLLVYERLHRFDPEQHFLEWLRAYYIEPCALAGHVQASIEDGAARFATTASPDFLAVVSLLAEALGLWMERNWADDLGLWYTERALFEELLAFVIAESKPDGRTTAMTNAVRDRLTARVSAGRDIVVRWEWRHVASLKRAIAGRPRADWWRRLWACGFVTVVCPESTTCYAVVQRLHEAFDYQPRSLVDWIGSGTRGGYKAYHTRLLAGTSFGELPISVRVMPSAADAARHQLASVTVKRLAEDVGPMGRAMRVYTRDGEAKYLPMGSTVLNFAYAVHNDLVAYVRGAIINERTTADVLAALRDDDVVELILGNEPRPLPAEWEHYVPRSQVGKIKSKFRAVYSPLLEGSGRRRLRMALNHANAGIAPDDDRVLEVLLDFALEAKSVRSGRCTVASWLRRLGSRDVVATELEVVDSAVTEGELNDVVDEMVRISSSLASMSELSIGSAERRISTRVDVCAECQPESDSELCVTADGAKLIVHRRDCACSVGGTPISTHRFLTLHQFFTIETNNRAGVGADVLNVFRQYDVDVVEIVGRRSGPDWAVLRIEAEAIGPSAVREIIRALKAVPDVQHVIGPDDDFIPLLEADLPPRRDMPESLMSLPEPYVCGPPLVEDHHFYGRGPELRLLAALAQRASRGGRGAVAFVSGPLKVGKTSLVLRFLRDLRRSKQHEFLTAHVKVATDSSWAEIEEDLIRQLEIGLHQLPPQRVSYLHEQRDLVTAIQMIQRHSTVSPTIVLAIDETIRLFCNPAIPASNVAESAARLCEFAERTPGVVAIWIGPSGSVRHLPSQFRSIIQSAQPVAVGPLSKAETQLLLSARKLAYAYDIQVPDNISATVHRLTAGNPHWTALLANAMWSRAQRRTAAAAVFTETDLWAARDEIVELGTPFEDRIYPSVRSEASSTYCLQIMRALAQGGSRARSGASQEFISRALLEPLPHSTLSELLQELVERGALDVIDRGPRRWRISSPLLAEYVRREASRDVEAEATA